MGRESNKSRRQANEQTARARAAAMRLEAQKRERRRRGGMVAISIVAVLAVVGAIIGVAINNNHKNQAATAASSKVLTEVADVSPATLAKVGVSDAAAEIKEGATEPQTISDPALTSGGKPELLYIGAEFCPYCAAERWAMIANLDKFGTFTGIQEIHSSEDNIPTFTFYKSSYTSKYLTFVPVENGSQDESKQLQKVSAAQQAIWLKYTQGSYPFQYYGGKIVVPGPTYSPTILEGLTQAKIAAQLNDPTSKVGQAIDSSVNELTASTCAMTDNKPASVCTSSIQSLESSFPAFKASSATSGSTAVATTPAS